MPAFFCTLLLWLSTAWAMTAEELLDAVDQNMVFDSRTTTVTMTVTKGKRVKTYSMKSFGRGADEAAIEYLEPARDRGTKMLKKGNELWLYMPAIEKTQKISGHMLRQGMMGSDFSYEDMLESTKMRQMYSARVAGEENVNGRACWRLELTAKDTTVAYPKRVSLLDKETLIPIRQELFALSGTLLKVWLMSDVKDFDGRKYPTHMVIEDALRAGHRTELVFVDMQFSVDLEDEVFSMRWLER